MQHHALQPMDYKGIALMVYFAIRMELAQRAVQIQMVLKVIAQTVNSATRMESVLLTANQPMKNKEIARMVKYAKIMEYATKVNLFKSSVLSKRGVLILAIVCLMDNVYHYNSIL